MLHAARPSVLRLGLSLAAIGVAAWTAYALSPPRRMHTRRLHFMPVRDAGPANMESPPLEWDRVDEAVDESFPASDPPCHCVRSPYDRKRL
jgi:hypothetical protein